MDIVHTIILSIVEGLTEFLPISSTFHLIFASKILGVPQTDFLQLFEIFIQAGAILAALVLFYKDLFTDKELFKKVAVAFVPTAIIGFVLYKVIKKVFFTSDWLMVSVFIIMAFVFFLVEWLIKSGKFQLNKNIKELSYKDAVIIGLVQSLAVIPGVSRAGAVLVGMMVQGYKRDEAARFSFILAIPTIFAASGYDLFKSRAVLFTSGSNALFLIIGFVVAFISAYIVMKWFIGYLKTHSLNGFGIYRIIVALILYFAGFIR